METDHVAKPATIQGDQNHSSPRAERHYRPIEVHYPVLVGDIRGQDLDFRPFGDEFCKGLRLNCSAWDIPNVMAHELECPLGDSSHGVVVVDDLPQWV